MIVPILRHSKANVMKNVRLIRIFQAGEMAF